MSTYNALKELSQTFGDLAEHFGITDNVTLGDKLAGLRDLFNDLAEAGIDPTDAANDENELVRDITDIFASIAITNTLVVATGAVAGAAILPLGGIILAVSAFYFEESLQELLGVMSDKWGLTLVGKDYDARDLPGPIEFIGSLVSDTIITSQGDDTVYGFAGGDFISNVGGSDTIYGGDGVDTVSYANLSTGAFTTGIYVDALSAPNAILVSRGGDEDTLSDIEIIIGTGKVDTFDVGNLGYNLAPGIFDGYIRQIDAGGGDDVFVLHNIGGAGPHMIELNAGTHDQNGDFLILGDDGFNTFVNLQEGTVRYSGGANAHFAISGFENVIGSDSRDNIIGNDSVNTIDGGGGNDMIEGGAGNDIIDGGTDNDTINGGDDDDTIKGGDGNDTLEGGAGNDILDGGLDDDILVGGDDDDRLQGRSGDDILYGGDGRDTLYGNFGDDLIYGGDKADAVRGSKGNDTVYGEGGNDNLFGDEGNDTISGGAGNDKLEGGEGADVFIFSTGDGSDLIRDLNVHEDFIDLSGIVVPDLSYEEYIFQAGNKVVIDFGGGDVLTLANMTLEELGLVTIPLPPITPTDPPENMV